MVLPATPGGSPAAGEWQVNVPLTRNNDLPYGLLPTTCPTASFWRLALRPPSGGLPSMGRAHSPDHGRQVDQLLVESVLS